MIQRILGRNPPGEVAGAAASLVAWDRDAQLAACLPLWRGLLPLMPPGHVSLGLVSVHEGEAASAAAVHLALAATELHVGPVLLLEASPGEPGLPQLLNLQANPGLADWRRGDAELETCLQEVAGERLVVMTAGAPAVCPDGQIDWAQSLARIGERFAITVCDLGAAEIGELAPELLSSLGGVLLVIEAGRVTDAEARRLKQRLLELDARLLGVIWSGPSASAAEKGRV